MRNVDVLFAVLLIVAAVFFTSYFSFSIGIESMQQYIVSNCEKHQVFAQDGLIIQCNVVHQAK